jgi:hypothetical protein
VLESASERALFLFECTADAQDDLRYRNILYDWGAVHKRRDRVGVVVVSRRVFRQSGLGLLLRSATTSNGFGIRSVAVAVRCVTRPNSGIEKASWIFR